MVKPHGFVLDFVGIFDKLERALAFDSDEIDAVVKEIGLLKTLFKNKMETKGPEYLALGEAAEGRFTDKTADSLVAHFRDKDKRHAFFKEYKEIEMLYEIISPDPFLRPYLDDYASLSALYQMIRSAYTRGPMVDRDFLKKTNQLVQQHIGLDNLVGVTEFVEIDENTI